MTGPLGPFVGGGDTDFEPVFDEAKAARQFEGLVYFTDGKGSLPALPPSIPTLWALTHGDPFEPGWGCIVRLPE
jgi:predicted metal-dependent peptidase